MHCIFFERIGHKEKYINSFCIDRYNWFHNLCRQWYQYNNPQLKNDNIISSDYDNISFCDYDNIIFINITKIL